MNAPTEISQSITNSRLKEIKAELTELKPAKFTLDGKHSMTVKEAIFALIPTLERMKKRGFDTRGIAEKLHEKDIEIKPPTLAKYLNEFRREKDNKKDTLPPHADRKGRAYATTEEARQGEPKTIPHQTKYTSKIFVTHSLFHLYIAK